MSHLTDKAANGTTTQINNGSQTVTANGIVNNSPNNGNDTPASAISYNAPSSNGSSNVSLSSPSGSSSVDSSNDRDDSYDYYALQRQYEQQLAAYKAEQEALAAEQEAAKKKALQAAVDQTTNKLNAQKTTTSQDYADMYRQLYINNMKSQRNINQQLAAQGQTGGAAESTLLGLNTDYEDNLRQGKTSEQNALSELDQAITDAQLSADIEAANAVYDTAAQKASAYSTAYQQYLSALQNAQSQAASLAANQESENRSYNYQLAMAMLESGTMPSDTLLKNAGISSADAQAIVAQYVAAKNAKSSTASTGTTTGGETASSILESAKWLANNQGKSAALAYLKKAYNGTAFDSVSGDKYSVYNSMVNSINNMF